MRNMYSLRVSDFFRKVHHIECLFKCIIATLIECVVECKLLLTLQVIVIKLLLLLAPQEDH